MSKAQYALRARITVHDKPEPGGNKNAFPIYEGSAKNGTRKFSGRTRVVEQNKNMPLWRKAVRHACRPNGRPVVFPPLDVPLVVRFMFTLERPASVSVKRRPYPSVKPDCSKLVRGTEDEITQSGIWADDSRIVSEVISKAYVGEYHPDGTPALDIPGCVIEIYEILPPQS